MRSLISRILIFIASIVYSFYLYIPYATSNITFGSASPPSQSEKMIGSVLFIAGIFLAVTSIFVFKKRNFIPVLILVIISICTFLLLFFLYGTDIFFDLSFVYPFAIVILYRIDSQTILNRIDV